MRLVIEGVEDGVLQEMAKFRANLIWLRKQHGLTNHELGLLAGVKERQVSIWMNAPVALEPNGTDAFNPRMVNIAKLGAALGVPLGDFFLDPASFQRRHKKLRPLVLLAARPSSSNRRSSPVSPAEERNNSPLCQLLELPIPRDTHHESPRVA